MANDPIIQEIRDIRHAIEKECQGDSERYYQHLLSLQEKSAERLVRRQPKPLITSDQKKVS